MTEDSPVLIESKPASSRADKIRKAARYATVVVGMAGAAISFRGDQAPSSENLEVSPESIQAVENATEVLQVFGEPAGMVVKIKLPGQPENKIYALATVHQAQTQIMGKVGLGPAETGLIDSAAEPIKNPNIKALDIFDPHLNKYTVADPRLPLNGHNSRALNPNGRVTGYSVSTKKQDVALLRIEPLHVSAGRTSFSMEPLDYSYAADPSFQPEVGQPTMGYSVPYKSGPNGSHQFSPVLSKSIYLGAGVSASGEKVVVTAETQPLDLLYQTDWDRGSSGSVAFATVKGHAWVSGPELTVGDNLTNVTQDYGINLSPVLKEQITKYHVYEAPISLNDINTLKSSLGNKYLYSKSGPGGPLPLSP